MSILILGRQGREGLECLTVPPLTELRLVAIVCIHYCRGSLSLLQDSSVSVVRGKSNPQTF